MRNLRNQWTLPLGALVIALFLGVLGWSLFAKSRRIGVEAAGSASSLIGSEATDTCPVVTAAPLEQRDKGDGGHLQREIPALDRRQPSSYETATFAMG